MESTVWHPSGDAPGDWDRLDGSRVIAFCTSDDPKRIEFLGPIRATAENAQRIDVWAQLKLDLYGGYVHLLFVDDEEAADHEAALAELAAEIEADYENDPCSPLRRWPAATEVAR